MENRNNNIPSTANTHTGEVILYVMNDGNAKVEAISGNISAYGYTPEDFISDKVNIQDIIYDGDIQEVMMRAVEHLKNKSEWFTYDCRIFDKSGAPVWITNTVTPVYNSEGVATHFFVKFASISPGKQRERMPGTSDSLFDTFTNIGEAVIILDVAGRIDRLNPAAERVTGLSDAKTRHKALDKVMRFSSSENLATAIDPVKMISETLSPLQFDEIFIRDGMGGRCTRVSCNILPVYIGQDPPQLAGYMLVIKDLTALHELWLTSRKNRNTIRSIFDHSTDGIVLISADGVVREWSRGYEQITGLPEEQAVGRTLWEVLMSLFPPEEQTADIYNGLRREIKLQISGQRCGMAQRNIVNRVSGQRKIIQGVYFPVNLSGTTMMGAISRDVTEMHRSQELLRQSEQKLRESNELLESIMEAVPAPLYVKNKRCEYTGCNEEFVNMTGLPKDQIIGKTISEILPQFADRVIEIDQKLLNEINKEHTGILSDYFAEIESMVYRNFLIHNGQKEGIVGVTLNVSELKRTERQLTAERDRLQALGDHFPNGCLFRLEIDNLTNRGTVTYISKPWEQLTGLKREDVLQNINLAFERVYPDDLPLIMQSGKNMDTQNNFSARVRYLHPDGNTLWLRISAHRHDEGAFRIFDGFIIDITAQKLAEMELERYREELESMVKERTEELETTNEELYTTNEELHQYREHLEQMVEQKTREVTDGRERLVSLSKHLTGGVIFQITGKEPRTFRFSFISDYFTKFFGIDVNKVMSQSKLFYKSIYPDDLWRFKRHYIKACEHGDPGIEFRIRNPQGGIKWVHMRASHRMVDEMHVWDGFMLDITPHKLAEQELEDARKRQDIFYKVLQIFQSTEDIARAINFALKEVGNYAKVDRVYIVEKEAGEIYEWCNTGISPAKEQFRQIAGSVQAVTDVLKAGRYVQTSEIAGLSPEFLQFLEDAGILSVLGFPLMVDGVYYGLAGFDDCKTVREWNRNEIDLLGGLSQIIANAIRRQQAEQELIRARDKAEESDRLKSSFLANISHELRTPLNGITGYLQFLTCGNISPDLRQEYTQVVNTCSRQLVQLIEDVIDIAKMEANQLKIFPKVTDINRMMHDLLLMFETELKAQGKDMVALLLDDTGFIHPGITYIDQARLQQVLFHLVGNAIKFTQKGYIRFGYQLQPTGMLEFTVEDTGIGIPEDKYGIIFERFRQIEQGNNRFYGGTGIGLSIAQSLVQLMGGRMYLQSAVGEGSTFSFTMPYLPVAPDEVD